MRTLRLLAPLFLSLLTVAGCGSEGVGPGEDLAMSSGLDGGETPLDGATDLPGLATDGSLPPGSTVAGRVIDVGGDGIAQASVEIGGVIAVTDAEGRFSVAAPAAAPFDVRLSFTSPGPKTIAALFVGVARLDPTLQLPFDHDPSLPSQVFGTIGGPLAGLGKPAGSTYGVLISPLGSSSGVTASTTYSATQRWIKADAADTSRTVAVRALFWDSIDTPTYTAYGKSADVVVQAAQTTPDVTITTAAPTVQDLTATITGAPMNGSYRASVGLLVGNAVASLGFRTIAVTVPQAVAVPAPAVDGGRYDLSVTGGTGDRYTRATARSLVAGGAAGSIALDALPSLLDPATATTVPLSGTTFRIQHAADRVRVYSFDYPDTTLHVITTARELSFPSFSSLSIAAPAAATKVTWNVKSYTATTVSEALGPHGYTATRADLSTLAAGELFVETASGPHDFFVQ